VVRFASRAAVVALFLATAASLLLSGAPVRAQPTDEGKVAAAREAARSLALKALAKIDAGQVAEGIALLEQAEASFHAPTHLLYLAQAHAAIGHAAVAAQTYDALVREELPNYAPDEFREAERIGRVELAAVESRVGRVKIVLVGANGRAPSTVRVDGSLRKVAADVVFIEPGVHEIEVEIGGQLHKARVTVAAGELQQTIFDVGLQPKVREGDVGFAGVEPEAPGPPYVIPGAILLSVGGAALAAGAVTGVLSLQDVGELSDRCPSRIGCDPADRELADRARLRGNVSTAMFAIGGVAAVTGAVLVFIPAPRADAKTSLFRPVIGPTFLGVEGSFY
jgi:hypothetical protein